MGLLGGRLPVVDRSEQQAATFVLLPEGSYSSAGTEEHRIHVVPFLNLVIVYRVNTDIEGRRVLGSQFCELVRWILTAGPRCQQER